MTDDIVAGGSVTNAKLGLDAVNSGNIVDGQVMTDDLAVTNG